MKKLYFVLTILWASYTAGPLYAQTPGDGLMMAKGDICFAALYQRDSWDEYWEGTLLRDNGNIGTFTRQTVVPMFALGLTDRINLIAMMPWTSSEASNGQLKGISSLQDFSVFLKARAIDATLGAGQFTLHPVVGISLPATNYLEDYMPFSPGFGCPDLSLRGIAQYRLDMGFYVRALAAYQVRGTAKIERDFYYTTHGIYSDKVDMPNALVYGATIGQWLFDNTLNIEATYDGMNTFGGFDIRRQDAGFPANKMIFTRVGGGFHWFTPFAPGFGIVGSAASVLTGRNVGKSTMFTAGLTYQFGLFGQHHHEEVPMQ